MLPQHQLSSFIQTVAFALLIHPHDTWVSVDDCSVDLNTGTLGYLCVGKSLCKIPLLYFSLQLSVGISRETGSRATYSTVRS